MQGMQCVVTTQGHTPPWHVCGVCVCVCVCVCVTVAVWVTQLELKAYNSSARSIPSGFRPGARKLLLPDGAHRLQVDGTLGSVTVEAADGHGAMPVTALQFVVGSVGDVREMRAGPDAVKKVLRTLVVMPS